MDIDFDDALSRMGDDDEAATPPAEPVEAPPAEPVEAPRTEPTAPRTEPVEAPRNAPPAEPAEAPRNPTPAEPVEAPRTAPTAPPAEPVEAPSAEPVATGSSAAPAPEHTDNRRNVAIAAGVGLALLGVVGAALLGGGDDKEVNASPSPTPTQAGASPSTSWTPSARPSVWAMTAADPATTTISQEQAMSWCKAKPDEQVVGRKGGALRPGGIALVGPKSATPPTTAAVSAPWRGCTLGYHTMPSPKPVGEAELKKDLASLTKACSVHSGFTFDSRWKPSVMDARFNPRTNNVSDASLALTTPDGWAAGCEISAGSDVATLTFLPPKQAMDVCPTVNAASMAKPGGGPGGPAPAGGPGGGASKPGPDQGPGGMLYWVTAFGRVPNVDGLPAKAASAGFNLGPAAESNAMVHVKDGVVVANHTWKPDQAVLKDKSKKPTLTFFDKGGKKLYSCTPA